MNLFAAGIVSISCYFHQPAALQAGHYAAHGGGLHLLGGSQFAERFGTTENQHRERRQPSWTLTGNRILIPDPPEQVNGGGMQPVGNRIYRRKS